MEFRYIIPKHIQGYLEDIPESTLQVIMTYMFELAIQHRMIDYPRFSVEQDITEMKESLAQIILNNQSDISKILESIDNLTCRLDTLGLVAAPRVHTSELATIVKEVIPDIITLGFDAGELIAISDEGVDDNPPNDEKLEAKFIEDMLK